MSEGQTIEATGTDVEAAIVAGLADLGVERDAVEVDVVDEGSRGVMGFGARGARVRLTVKPQPASAAPAEPGSGPALTIPVESPSEPAAPPILEPSEMEAGEPGKDEAEVARGVVLELLALLGLQKAEVDVRRAKPAPGEKEPPLMLDVHGPGADALIGRRGATMAALQRITRLIVGQEMASRVNLVVDVAGFKARREESLHHLAQRVAEQAVRTERTVVLEPMPAHERRVIHMALRDHPHVTTQSVGEGERRKVTIIPHRSPVSS